MQAESKFSDINLDDLDLDSVQLLPTSALTMPEMGASCCCCDEVSGTCCCCSCCCA